MIGGIAGDWNQDHCLDIASLTSQFFYMYYNNCASGYQSRPHGVSGELYGIQTADLDGDGDMDLRVGNNTLFNNGSGFFSGFVGGMDNVKYDIYLAELDGDGDIDLVKSSTPYSGGRLYGIETFKNDGVGLFSLSSTVNIATSSPVNIVSGGDFDNDGDFDLVAAGLFSYQIYIFENQNGSFSNYTAFSPGGYDTVGLVTGDFDGDGNCDIAALYHIPQAPKIYFGDGALGISETIDVVNTVDFIEPVSLERADFDGDGDLDLVGSFNQIGPNYGNFAIFTNDGPRQFSTGYVAEAGIGSHGLAVGDFDNDGDVDLAGSVRDTVTLTDYWLITYENMTPFADIELSTDRLDFGVVPTGQSSDLVFEIANLGGTVPLNVSEIYSGDPEVFRVSPGSVQVSAQNRATISVTYLPVEAKIYHDSITIISDDPDESKLFVMLTGSSIFKVESYSPPAFSSQNQPAIVSALFTGQIDTSSAISANIAAFGEISGFHNVAPTVDSTGNHILVSFPNTFISGEKVSFTFLDKILSSPSGLPLEKGLQWEFNIASTSGEGEFVWDNQPIPTATSAHDIVAGDWNIDKLPDIAITDAANNSVRIFKYESGTFSETEAVVVGSAPQSLATGDLNNDGAPDLVVSNSQSGNISILMNQGNGSFNVSNTYSTAAFPRAISIADINLDGYLDIAIANINSNSISIFMNDNTGSFYSPTTLMAGTFPSDLLFADVDNDADADLLVINKTSEDLYIFENQDGNLFLDSSYSIGIAPTALDILDLENDADADILIALESENAVQLFRNDAGIFTMLNQFSTGQLPVSLTTGDFNADQYVDFASSDFTSGSVSIFINDTTGSFLARDSVQLNTGIRSLAAISIDNSGIMDLAAVNFLDQDILILRNDAPTVVETSIAPATSFSLLGNYPNPFNPSTTIEFHLPEASSVTLEIFNIVGQRIVGVYRDKPLSAGAHTWSWNGTDGARNPVTSGTYIYRLTAKNGGKIIFQEERKMLLIK